MKRIIAVVMFVCCVGFVVAQPVLAANSNVEESQIQTLLNVNAADETALTALPGVGKVTAERIVAFRTEQGPFKSVDDLVQVKGVGKKMLEKIRPLVTI